MHIGQPLSFLPTATTNILGHSNKIPKLPFSQALPRRGGKALKDEYDGYINKWPDEMK
jgi:hypothetical protein